LERGAGRQTDFLRGVRGAGDVSQHAEYKDATAQPPTPARAEFNSRVQELP